MNVPGADAPQEWQFRLRVDEAHGDRAANGLRLMAQYQYRSLVQRYEGMGWLKRVRQGSRQVAAVVFAAALAAIWVGCVDESTRRVYVGLAALLILEPLALALWLLPRRADRMGAGLAARFARSFGNRGAALMRKTRRAVPFEAVYDLRGDLLTYARLENGQWTQRWHRHLGRFRPRGVALQTPGLLVIFRKPGTVVPAVIVLTTGDGAMATAIRALGWTIVDIDPTSGEPEAPAAGPDLPTGDARAAGRAPGGGLNGAGYPP